MTLDTLFQIEPDPETDSVAVEWSFSRRLVLFQCPRRHYYQYFGGSNWRAKDERAKEILSKLKRLTNAHLRAGPLRIQGATCDSLYDYCHRQRPSARVRPEDRVARVSFPGLDKPALASAKRLCARVMNDALPRKPACLCHSAVVLLHVVFRRALHPQAALSSALASVSSESESIRSTRQALPETWRS